MLVYRVTNSWLESDVVWTYWQDALEEIKTMLSEDSDIEQTITLTVEEMSQADFEALPEFEGY